MDFLRSGIKSILGSSAVQKSPSGAEIIERLVDRVKNSLVLEDRRDAVRALKSLSKKFRVEVGAQGMDALIQILETDRVDTEIVSYALYALYNVTSNESWIEDNSNTDSNKDFLYDDYSYPINENVGEQFSEMFLKNSANLQLVLSYLDDSNFNVRWPAVQLLSSLVENLPKTVQQLIMLCPNGVSKLIDLLDEPREIIRNQVVLLLLQLANNNGNIQKILVFENVINTLLRVIQLEDCLNGGIVVEDCLNLIFTLLKNNVSNQCFFKESGLIQKFTKLLFDGVSNISDNDCQSWSNEKVVNFNLSLKVIRTLIHPNNSQQNTTDCQILIRNCSFLHKLCDLLMTNARSTNVLTEVVYTIGDIIRANSINQQIFSQVMAPTTPPRTILTILMISMVNEKQPFHLRCAILYCFQCYLYKHESGQSEVVNTLSKSNNSSHHITVSEILYRGTLSSDSSCSWFSYISLAHCLMENKNLKETLLNVVSTVDSRSEPTVFLDQCLNQLLKSKKVQMKIGLLIFLCIWLCDCSSAVNSFLESPNALMFLISQISSNDQYENEELLQSMSTFLLGIIIKFNDNNSEVYSKNNLYKIIEKNIGYEDFLKKLTNISTHDLFGRTVKNPHISFDKPNDLLLDYEFCQVYRHLEGVIIKELRILKDLSNGISEITLTDEENGLLMQYKNLIREQDAKLNNLSKSLNLLEEENTFLKQKINELEQLNTNLTNDNNYLKSLVDSFNSTIRSDISENKPICLTTENDQQVLLKTPSEKEAELTNYNTMFKNFRINIEDSRKFRDV